MTRPEGKAGSGSSRPVLAGVALLVAVLGAVVSAVVVVTLDLRRGEQVRDLETQLESLRHLVEAMGQQLEHHDRLINITLQAKNTPKSEPSEEVVYEDEYEYDDEEEYEDDEDDEQSGDKRTIAKRTAEQSKNRTSEEQKRRKRHAGVPEESTTNSGEYLDRPVQETHPVVYQERAPETVRYRHKSSRARSRSSDRETSLELQSSEYQPRVFAAHFIGDTSRYNQRDHRHYYGNDILYHPHNLFKDWLPASWMTEEDVKHFPIQDGKIKINNSGLYFVYAQIFYSATHNHCGFHIKQNDREVAQCTTSTSGAGLKRNTCYTALVLRLERHDLLWVREVEGHRNTSFRDSHSYFGLIKLLAS